MKCKSCKKVIDDDSLFCKWCGASQIRRPRERKAELIVPKARKLKSGNWNVQLRLDGQVISITKPTEREALAEARAVKAGIVEKKKAPMQVTVRALCEKYISDRESVLSPSTLMGYRQILRNRFKEALDCPVESVNWQKVVNDETKLVCGKTLKNSWSFIAAAIKAAKLPVPEVTLAQVIRRDLPWLDFEQIAIFINAIRDKPCEIGALLALHSLRRSELLAITPEKIINRKGKYYIKVEGAIVRSSDGMVPVDTNKNQASRREVPVMMPRLVDLIKTRPAGECVVVGDANSLWRSINKICREHNLPEVGVHGLRRSFASLAWYLNWDMLTTMRLGGWSDDTVVREIYTKLSEQTVNKDIENMIQFYEGLTQRTERE